MKNALVFGIMIVMLVVLAGCSEGGDGSKTHSGTVNANDEGKIIFNFGNETFVTTIICKFTTDLPSPNDTFSLSSELSSEYNVSSDRKIIDGLTPGQAVNWTAKSDYYIKKWVKETGTVSIYVRYDE